MDHYLFAVRSATQAQRAARVLNSGGIHASVQRVPVEFARQGCTYAVRVDDADYDVVQQRLQQPCPRQFLPLCLGRCQEAFQLQLRLHHADFSGHVQEAIHLNDSDHQILYA